MRKIYFDRTLNGFVGLSPEILDDYSRSYPGLDIAEELRKMKAWLLTTKGKNCTGTEAFILAWLARGEKHCAHTTTTPTANTLKPLIKNYLEKLWAGREPLLEMNMKAS